MSRGQGRYPGLWRWLPVLAYAGLIFGLSSIPGDYLQRSGVSCGTLLHVVAYAGLGALLARALRAPSRGLGRVALLSVGMGTLYGLSDEAHQLLVPGRAAELTDVLADLCGTALGALAVVVVVPALGRCRAPR